MTKTIGIYSTVAIVITCAFLSGCSSSKVSKANYDKISTGMSVAEVEAILGPGEVLSKSEVKAPEINIPNVTIPDMSMSGKSIVWKDGFKVISIIFINDKATGISQLGL